MSDDGCEELRFTRLMDSHVCYDLIPHTSKLVVFDTQLTVTLKILIFAHHQSVQDKLSATYAGVA